MTLPDLRLPDGGASSPDTPGGPDGVAPARWGSERRRRVTRFGGRLPSTTFALAMAAPAVLALLGFSVLPFFLAVWDSLQEPSGGLGLENYELMVNDRVFRQSLRNNVVFAVVTVPLTLAIALVMATLLDQAIRARSLLRLACFTPTILPTVAASAIWLFFYQPTFGPINRALALFGVEGQNWLGNPRTVLPALAVVMIWKEVGLFMLLYLASLHRITAEMREASSLEGASNLRHFLRIVLPMTMPTTVFCSIVATANAFRSVDFLFVMTRGGPANASSLLLYYVWESLFVQRRWGLGAAIVVVLTTMLLLIAFVQVRLLERRTFYR